MDAVAIVAALVLIEYMVIVGYTGQARGQYGVAAPAVTGHPVFERWLRVQANTVEQLVIFFPGLWLFSRYVNAPVAAALGLVFLVGRALFARGYVADPARRGPGFVLTYIANAVLVSGGLIGAIRSALGVGPEEEPARLLHEFRADRDSFPAPAATHRYTPTFRGAPRSCPPRGLAQSSPRDQPRPRTRPLGRPGRCRSVSQISFGIK